MSRRLFATHRMLSWLVALAGLLAVALVAPAHGGERRNIHGKWVVEAMDRGLIPCLRIQECNGGCIPSPGYPAIVVSVIREHLAEHRPQYQNRLIYVQLWNEPGDPRDFVTPEDFADYLVLFALEIPGWWSFDIASIVERLADYVAEPVVLTDP